MKKTNTKKLAIAGVFCAVAVVGSLCLCGAIFISTAGGAILSAVLIFSLKKANILRMMQESMER